MDKDTGCTTKQDWYDLEKNEERWLTKSKQRMENLQEHLDGDEVHSRQENRQLKETLMTLTSIMAEYRYSLQDMMTNIQEISNEVRLNLELIRTDLEKSSNESVFSEEVNKKSEAEQKIMANLTELVEGQEIIKSKLNDHSQIEEVTKLVKKMEIKQQDAETRKPLRCYWCHEEGHMKRNCPRRANRQKWMQT